mmetsp:Transcript_49268/g.158604  ORF Transcript_49268/g.158604 Transcript_49268/m.158604 type:complete len:96 (+) Transcript_49268:3119-3406(+)
MSQRAVATRNAPELLLGEGQLTVKLLGSEDHKAIGISMLKANEMGWPLAASTMDVGHKLQEAETPKEPSARWRHSDTALSKSCVKKTVQALVQNA